ncbi:MAG: type II secretion system protein GspG [Armatimonadetes bacterium]|nr:type II secretion system protein GspG [Armatimonadota bacterium]
MAEAERFRPRVVRVAWLFIALGATVAVWFMVSGATGEADLLPLGVRLITPRSFLVDSPGAVRIVVLDHQKHQPVSGAAVALRLTNHEGTQGTVLFEGRTNRAGTVKATFQVPDLPPGDYMLRAEARHGALHDEVQQKVSLRKDYQLLLVTDKPLYQPSQTLHLRGLVLRRPDLKPVADAEATFEVRDPKGNKVFKRKVKTNEFGAAWADFELADEINLGRYECRLLFGDGEAKRTVTVKRYVLPKFKVTLTTARSYYLPGMKLEGKVTAEYFFGKPVAAGRVDIKVRTFDVEYRQIAHIIGQTDKAGQFAFHFRLPRHFVGQPLEQGKAFVEFVVEVTDTAEHTEKIVSSCPVAGEELTVRALPESGQLVPNLPNRVWVMVNRPDGKPVASARIELQEAQAAEPWQVKWRKQQVVTDDLGLAEVEVTPVLTAEAAAELQGGAGGPAVERPPMVLPGGPGAGPGAPAVKAEGGAEEGGPITLRLAVTARDGTAAKKEIALSASPGGDGEGLLLRMDRALARVGESVRVTALTPRAGGYVYFDVVKDRQTMLTQAADVRRGRGEATITLGPELAGTVYISAYRLTRRGKVVRDTRPLVVLPAGDLKVEVRASKQVYRPGEHGRLDFMVRGPDGRPAVAALGVSVVDESVFALQEKQAGMERVYAYLEEELRKPRYEIHGLELPLLIAGPVKPAVGERQRAAQVMLASVKLPKLSVAEADSYAPRLAKAKKEWAKKMRPKVTVIRRALEAYRHREGELPTYSEGLDALVKRGYLKAEELKDLWGTPLRARPVWPGQDRMYEPVLVSAGPDGQFGTEDDVELGEPQRRRVFAPLGAGGRALEKGVLAEAMPGMQAAAEADHAAAPAGAAPGSKPVRVRQFFPETLLFRPDLITDEHGAASLSFDMADSITTWRLTALANSATGLLGSKDAPLRCFQDFFVDLDLPVALTQGDEVSVPVAVYNYLKTPQTIRLKLEKSDWFTLQGQAERTLQLRPNEVTVRYFPLKAVALGDHKLTCYAYGSKMSDAVRRSVHVQPDGKPVMQAASGRLSDKVKIELKVPREAIQGASTLLVKVYPGIFSQAVEGLDSILQMPFGCFEQTSSVTYPNVLVLDYMRSTHQITPEIQMKAEGFINYGYQRLLSYEVKGGGFSWFGDPPANKLLTALGVMEFYDMAQVYEVDEALIRRTQDWLAAQQEADGSWSPDESYLHQHTWQRLQNNKLLPTAYVTWALAVSHYEGDTVRRGLEYVRAHWEEADEPYQLAVVCNALVAGDLLVNKGDLDDATREALDKLVGMAKHEDDKMWWEGEMSGITHSSGRCADLETTGFAALALINSGERAAEATQVVNYLLAAKAPNGTWGSTQATMLALKALLLAQKGGTGKTRGLVTVTVNGRSAAELQITEDNADVLQMVDCRRFAQEGKNTIELALDGEGSMLYQVVAKYWLPWKAVVEPPRELLKLGVRYDRTKLEVNDTVTATATIENKAPGRTSMIVVDLGIPPGFSVETGDLAELVDQGVIDKYNLTGRQIIVYLEELGPGAKVTFEYRLRAKYPLRAKAPACEAYEYYNPDNRAEAQPRQIVVTQ